MNDPGRYEVLLANGVSEDKQAMIRHFELQATLNKRCKVPALHILLSHHPDDTKKIKGNEMQIIDDWIHELKVKKGIDLYSTQFAIIGHHDRDHMHYHIVANMVTNSGKRLNIDYIGLKMKDISKEITKRYQLTPAVERKYQAAVIENSYQIKRGINQVIQNFREVNRENARDEGIIEIDKLIGAKRHRYKGLSI